MKYSKGDKVRIRNIGWYEEMLSIPSKLVWQNKLTEDFIGIWCGSHVFRKEMCEFCGRVMTIQEVGIDFYLMEEDKMGYEFTDEMIAGEDVSWMYDGNLVAERFSDDKGVPKFRKDDRVETHDGLFGYIEDIEYDGVRKCYQYYVSFIVDGGYYYEEQLKFHERGSADSKLPKFKVGDKICRVLCGLSNGYLVTSVSDEYYGLLMGEGSVGVLPVAEQDEWVLLSAGDKKIEDLVEEANKLDADAFSDGYDQGYDDGQHDMNEWKLPDGFEFRDENGNVIEAKKIVLEKKKPKYPQSFEECCEVLSMPSYYKLRYSTYEHGYHEYTTSKDLGVLQSELDTLGKLLICRDAYWLTAGREMGLEGKWKPDWSSNWSGCEKFAIVIEGNEILTDVAVRRSRILVFPTKEMRDEFLKVFRNYIEVCKEFL